MSNKIQAIRGMNDILPAQNPYWHFFEEKCRQLAKRYGYNEIRTPILEKTELFKRSIGEVTDIVEKEMYTFEDRNGDSLTLRPEGTASCVRAVIEHGLAYNQTQRLWYMGPLFRHERPQKGRYRQFYQFGVEAFGFTGPDIDAEIVLMTATLWREIGLHNVELQINTLGSPASRQKYKEQLIAYLSKHIDELDEDSKRRLQTNPLRILDSKNPEMQSIIENAPKLNNSLDDESLQHYEGLKLRLQNADVKFIENPRLVRGLDYYTGMVFEWVTKELGAQGTICAGGRFDGLVEQLGGHATPAVGFALGCERVIELMQQQNIKDKIENNIDVYMILVGEQAEIQGLALAEKIRHEVPQLSLVVNCGGGNFKKQFAKADKSGAKYAVIIGDEEIQQNKFLVKSLRSKDIIIKNTRIQQEQYPRIHLLFDQLIDVLCKNLKYEKFRKLMFK